MTTSFTRRHGLKALLASLVAVPFLGHRLPDITSVVYLFSADQTDADGNPHLTLATTSSYATAAAWEVRPGDKVATHVSQAWKDGSARDHMVYDRVLSPVEARRLGVPA